jgi:hypothetical protein
LFCFVLSYFYLILKKAFNNKSEKDKDKDKENNKVKLIKDIKGN